MVASFCCVVEDATCLPCSALIVELDGCSRHFRHIKRSSRHIPPAVIVILSRQSRGCLLKFLLKKNEKKEEQDNSDDDPNNGYEPSVSS